MLKRRTNAYGRMTTEASTTPPSEDIKCEMRPGGMLVQQRTQNNKDASVPNLRLKIAYGAVRHEISVHSQATFGKGLEAAEQRLIFRGKERENGEYLDRCGVKDRSKVVLMEDPASIERRYVEMRRNAKIQSPHRAISDVSMEVDKLAEQVSAIEKSISNGVEVPEFQMTTLIEMLMRQAVRLDSITAEGDAAAKKTLQANRMQKSVEKLDALKIWNVEVRPVVDTTNFDLPPTTKPWELFD